MAASGLSHHTWDDGISVVFANIRVLEPFCAAYMCSAVLPQLVNMEWGNVLLQGFRQKILPRYISICKERLVIVLASLCARNIYDNIVDGATGASP